MKCKLANDSELTTWTYANVWIFYIVDGFDIDRNRMLLKGATLVVWRHFKFSNDTFSILHILVLIMYTDDLGLKVVAFIDLFSTEKMITLLITTPTSFPFLVLI